MLQLGSSVDDLVYFYNPCYHLFDGQLAFVNKPVFGEYVATKDIRYLHNLLLERANSFITTYAPSLGFRLPLIKSFLSQGLDVCVAAPAITPDILEKLSLLGVTCYQLNVSRTSLSLTSNISYSLDLFRLLARIRPDTTISYYPKSVIFSAIPCFLSRINKRVVIIEGLGYYFTSAKSISFSRYLGRLLLSLLYFFTLPFNSHVLVLNEQDLIFLRRLQPLIQSRLFLWGPIGLKVPIPKPDISFDTRLTFTFIGRFLLEKGIVEFIQASNLLSSFYPAAQFLILGSSDSNPGALDISCKETVKSPNIKFWAC